MSSPTTYASKALFEANGFDQPTTTPDDCCAICLEDLACEASELLSESEHTDAHLSQRDHTALSLLAALPPPIKPWKMMKAPKAEHKPVSELEHIFLDLHITSSPDFPPPDIFRLKSMRELERNNTYHHDEDEHEAIRIKACGHLCGSGCIKTWLQQNKNCPICRHECFEDRTMIGLGWVTQWNANMRFY